MMSSWLAFGAVIALPNANSPDRGYSSHLLASSIPPLPVMTTVGIGILVGAIVVGALIYLWRRPKK